MAGGRWEVTGGGRTADTGQPVAPLSYPAERQGRNKCPITVEGHIDPKPSRGKSKTINAKCGMSDGPSFSVRNVRVT